jgi:hypothetical protein
MRSKMKIVLILLFATCILETAAQEAIVLKKKGKTIQLFWTGNIFTFQLADHQWQSGTLLATSTDSFYLAPLVIRYYEMGTDTLHLYRQAFAIKDVSMLPTKKELINYTNDRPNIVLGHEKFVWIRYGLIFRVAGAGYLGLNIGNHLIDHDPPFATKNLANLGVGAGSFLFGEFLGHLYKPYVHLGKKYVLTTINLRKR